MNVLSSLLSKIISYRTGLLWIIHIFRLKLSNKLHTYSLFYLYDITPYVDKFHHLLRPFEHPQQERSSIFRDVMYKMTARFYNPVSFTDELVTLTTTVMLQPHFTFDLPSVLYLHLFSILKHEFANILPTNTISKLHSSVSFIHCSIFQKKRPTDFLVLLR